MSSALDAARQLHRAGRLAEAEAGYRRILATEPESAEVRHLLGVLACQRGEPEQAVALISEAVERDARQPAYYANLAVALKELGRLEEALEALQRAQTLAPSDPGIAYNLGAMLQALNRHADAVAPYERVLAAQPDHVDALSNLGLALVETDRPTEALGPLRRAVQLAPDAMAPRINLGLAFLALGAGEQAIECFRPAVAAAPRDVSLQLNLGNALHEARRFADAAAVFAHAAELAPRDASPHHNLANALRDLGEVDKALAAYQEALERDPTHLEAWRNRLSTLLYAPGVAPARRFAEHRSFAAAYSAQRAADAPCPAADPGRPLRIGYVSSDLRQHPVGRNLELLLAHHDRQRFPVTCYASVRRPDAMSERLRGMVTGWRDVFGLNDDAVAALVREDKIDILVLLAGRFDRNRPLVALRRPAPIQISLHDPATSGLEEIDYLIADRHLASRDLSERFSERILRLPSFYTHAPFEAAPSTEVDEAPGRPVTFAAFCHPAKLGPQVLALWGRLLARLPEARLQLAHGARFAESMLRERVHDALCAAGARPSQMDFLREETDRAGHLGRYRRVDVALDPFPFTGSTSSFEALWMGVPVVTLDGDMMVGRWTSAMLRTLKLEEWIATSPERYVEIAAALASDPARRAEIRPMLRSRLATSPITDGLRRARQIERLYRAVWRHRCMNAGPLEAR